jgi:hypothetical protein
MEQPSLKDKIQELKISLALKYNELPEDPGITLKTIYETIDQTFPKNTTHTETKKP